MMLCDLRPYSLVGLPLQQLARHFGLTDSDRPGSQQALGFPSFLSQWWDYKRMPLHQLFTCMGARDGTRVLMLCSKCFTKRAVFFRMLSYFRPTTLNQMAGNSGHVLEPSKLVKQADSNLVYPVLHTPSCRYHIKGFSPQFFPFYFPLFIHCFPMCFLPNLWHGLAPSSVNCK